MKEKIRTHKSIFAFLIASTALALYLFPFATILMTSWLVLFFSIVRRRTQKPFSYLFQHPKRVFVFSFLVSVFSILAGAFEPTFKLYAACFILLVYALGAPFAFSKRLGGDAEEE